MMNDFENALKILRQRALCLSLTAGKWTHYIEMQAIKRCRTMGAYQSLYDDLAIDFVIA